MKKSKALNVIILLACLLLLVVSMFGVTGCSEGGMCGNDSSCGCGEDTTQKPATTTTTQDTQGNADET